MSLVELDARPEYLGPSISTASRPRNFQGALRSRAGATGFILAQNATLVMTFGPTLEDIGDWDSASTTRLTVPAGVSRIRLFAQVAFQAFKVGGGGAFVEADSIDLHFLKNDAELTQYPLLRITPNVSLNRWSLSTPAIPCVLGDHFKVRMRAGLFAQTGLGVLSLPDADSSFGIEAVTGG